MAGKARVWYEVACSLHGSSEAKNVQTFKRVAVSAPGRNVAQKRMGCPLCK